MSQSAHLAGANADKVDQATVMAAAVATVIAELANVIQATILHFGYKGSSLFVILRMLLKIRIERNRAHHGVLAVTFFVISVVQIELVSRMFYTCIKIAFFRSIFFKSVAS